MVETANAGPEFAMVADIEVDAVLPTQRGYRLSGQGSDGTEYRVDLRFDLALDAKSRRALGELLTQSEVGIWRRRALLKPRLAARRPNR